MMYWYGDHMSTWGYGLGILSMVLFWGLLIAGVVVGVRFLARSSGPEQPGQRAGPGSPPSPEDVLAQRFARREIDADEYRERLAILRDVGRAAATP